MSKFYFVLISASLLALFATFDSMQTDAQVDECPALVETAIEVTNLQCGALGQNQACYGNVQIDASPFSEIDQFQFSQPGDVESLANIQAMQLGALNVANNTWGMARLEVMANIPDANFETVTLLLFGDVEIENQVQAREPIAVEIATEQRVNVRSLPNTSAWVVDSLEPGTVVDALGRIENTSWLRIQIPDGGTGWIWAELIETDFDLSVLDVEAENAPYYEPMQAFTLQTDITDSQSNCATAPSDGLLIQTPEGMGEITFRINEVTVNIGSTVFFQAQSGEAMTISTIEGQARVTVDGQTTTAFAGTQVTVPLTEDLRPTGSPAQPVPYDMEIMMTLPLETLPLLVEVLPPATEGEIIALQQVSDNQLSSTGTGNSAPSSEPGEQQSSDSSDDDDDNGRPDCPGNSCNAPGHNPDKCRGNNC
jgi:uncharacterized protein YgiM (DUF1202 family)